MYLCLQLLSTVAVGDTASLKKCIGALNAFEISIENGESSVDSDWVRAKRGWLLMNSQASRKTIDEFKNHVGNTKDISSCSATGVSPEEVDLFVLAFHGYLPADPFEGLSECIAVVLVAMPEMDRTLGPQRSYSLGSSIGNRFGAATAQLNYLYKSNKHSPEQVQTRAAKISSSLSGMPTDKRATTVKSYLSKCAWYNIPLESIFEGAGVAIK
jgi:hypothetical protein